MVSEPNIGPHTQDRAAIREAMHLHHHRNIKLCSDSHSDNILNNHIVYCRGVYRATNGYFEREAAVFGGSVRIL